MASSTQSVLTTPLNSFEIFPGHSSLRVGRVIGRVKRIVGFEMGSFLAASFRFEPPDDRFVFPFPPFVYATLVGHLLHGFPGQGFVTEVGQYHQTSIRNAPGVFGCANGAARAK